jgi:FAD/FMN-containing dehydrogenase
MEMVDFHLLEYIRNHHPHAIQGLIPDTLPKLTLLIEFDNSSQFRQNIMVRRAVAVIKNLVSSHIIAKNPKEQEAFWQIRRSAAEAMWMGKAKGAALPIIEDGCVPAEKLPELLSGVYRLIKKHKLEIATWGHAGDAHIHLQPIMDLSKTKDRQKVFALMDDYYDLVIKLGGTTSGAHNDGLLRAPYLEKLYGKDMYELFTEVKNICDPLAVLNPRIKLGVTRKDLPSLLRHEYSLSHLYHHLPYT